MVDKPENPGGDFPQCGTEAEAYENCAEQVCDFVGDALDQDVEPIACRNYEPSGGCSTWSPVSHIILDDGIDQVNSGFVADLVANSAPLWTCDDASIEGDSGYFEVANATSGELLYELGLRNGDVLQELNGIVLESFVAAANVFVLYENGETSFSLTVLRGSQVLQLSYELE